MHTKQNKTVTYIEHTNNPTGDTKGEHADGNTIHRQSKKKKKMNAATKKNNRQAKIQVRMQMTNTSTCQRTHG